MAVIDEKGRLFGVVNVVDALVVLVVLAMVVAGAALLLGGGDDTEPDTTPPEPTHYGTFAFTAPLESDAAHLAVNDTLTPTSGGETYVITDVYRSFATNGTAHLVTRVRYRGQALSGDAVLYGGDTVQLTTGTYRVNADVLGVNQSSDDISTTEVEIVVSTTVDEAEADAIEAGDRATLAGTEVARVTAIERTGSIGVRERLLVGVELTAWDQNPVPVFDGTALRVGNEITIVTDEVVIAGEVAAVGTADPGRVD